MPSKKKKSKSSKKRKTKATTNNLALTIDDLDEMQARNERQQQEAAAASRDPSDPSSVDLVNKTKDWPRRRREDMGKCESIAGSWLSFSLAKAKWIQLSSNKALHQAFTANRGTTLESVRLWMQHAEQTLCKFIVLDIILKNQKTVQQFHALGRGWVFILLQRSSCSSSSFGTGGGGVRGSGNGDFTKLKVWFESSTRVEVDHEMDMKAASLDGESRQQYVWGYNPQSERYSPFTFTPRDCMGKNFAQMEMRVILAYLFHHFDFSLAGTTADFDRKTFLGVNRATLGPQDLGVDSQSPAELGLYMKIKARR